jgi:hypothetical protein
MGEELNGAAVQLDGVSYEWICLTSITLDVKKALAREVVVGNRTHACVLCWHKADPTQHC